MGFASKWPDVQCVSLTTGESEVFFKINFYLQLLYKSEVLYVLSHLPTTWEAESCELSPRAGWGLAGDACGLGTSSAFSPDHARGEKPAGPI